MGLPDKIEPRKTPLLSGHVVEPLTSDKDKEIVAQLPGHTYGLVRLQPDGLIMPTPFGLFHDRIYNFKYTDSDVMVMTYPKCGTTWMQEIVWTMRNNPDLKNPMAEAPVNVRVPFLELDSIVVTKALPEPGPDHPLSMAFKQICGPDASPADGVFIQIGENTPKPRTLKTHLPFSLLGPDILDTTKVIYVMRNLKDAVVSLYHHMRIMKVQDYQGTLEQLVDLVCKGDVLYGHYDLHLKEAFARASNKNLLIITYEEMVKNTMDVIKKLDKFLCTNLNEDQFNNVLKYTSFAEMKKRDNVAGKSDDETGIFNTTVVKKEGGFFRKGQVGSYKEKLTPALEKKIEDWIEAKLAGTDIKEKFNY